MGANPRMEIACSRPFCIGVKSQGIQPLWFSAISENGSRKIRGRVQGQATSGRISGVANVETDAAGKLAW